MGIEEERAAIEQFLVQVTVPIIARVSGLFAVIGTGTLFTIAGRYFLGRILIIGQAMSAFEGS